MSDDRIVDVTNDLTPEQREAMGDKIEKLMCHYSRMQRQSGNSYFSGAVDGLNSAWKLIYELDDDYNTPGLTDEELEEIEKQLGEKDGL